MSALSISLISTSGTFSVVIALAMCLLQNHGQARRENLINTGASSVKYPPPQSSPATQQLLNTH